MSCFAGHQGKCKKRKWFKNIHNCSYFFYFISLPNMVLILMLHTGQQLISPVRIYRNQTLSAGFSEFVSELRSKKNPKKTVFCLSMFNFSTGNKVCRSVKTAYSLHFVFEKNIQDLFDRLSTMVKDIYWLLICLLSYIEKYICPFLTPDYRCKDFLFKCQIELEPLVFSSGVEYSSIVPFLSRQNFSLYFIH